MELLFKLGPHSSFAYASIFCPGNDKFWSSSEKQCEIKFVTNV